MAAHTLAYQSFSLHEASFENPRAIVFGNSGKLILTFNGSKAQRNFGNLEIMTFDERKGFEFRELNFLKEPNNESGIEKADIEKRSPNVIISKANPVVCTQCHGPSQVMPIFQPYFTWPGLYGSDDDNLFRVLKKSAGAPEASFNRVGKFEGEDLEKAAYGRYLANRRTNARYSNLPTLPKTEERAIQKYFGDDAYESRPNLALLLTFNEQTEKILYRDLMAKQPSTDQLTGLAESICAYANPGQVSPYLKKIDATGSKRKLARQRFDQAEESIRKEDLGRVFDAFGTSLVPSFGYGDDFNRDGFAKHALFGSEPSQAEVDAYVVLKQIGLDLSEYSFSLRREPNFANGFQPLFTLKTLISDELRRRKVSAPPACSE